MVSKALEIAEERFAKGEISRQEFDELKSTLTADEAEATPAQTPITQDVSLKYMSQQSNKWGWKKTLLVGALIGAAISLAQITFGDQTLGQRVPNATSRSEVMLGIAGQIVGGAVGFMFLASIVTFIRNLFVK